MPMDHSAAVTVSISRTPRQGCEAAFEKALHDFVQRTLPLPGQLGVHIMRPPPGTGQREYSTIRKFASYADLLEFRKSAEYQAWNEAARGMTEGEARVEELSGLESWFTVPGKPLVPLPKWKMAILTLLGVYPTSVFLGFVLAPWTSGWHALLGSLVFAAAMVALLTWLVMPALSRLLHRWLRPGPRLPKLG